MKLINSLKALSGVEQTTFFFSLLVLATSLTQPAFYINRADNPAAWVDSLYLFFFGWTFPLGGAIIPFLIWCANPIYLISIFNTLNKKINRKIVGFILSIIATIIAFSFSQLKTIITSEAGGKSSIKSLELGYKLWLFSFVIMSIGLGINLYLVFSHKRKTIKNIN